MKKRILSLAVAMMATVMIFAVPAKPGKHTIKLADGKLITAELVGDEHAHWYAAEDGKAYNIGDDGIAYEMTAQMLAEAKAHAKMIRSRANERRQRRMAQGPRHGFGEQNSYLGDKKGIVILVNFSDKEMASTHDNALFDRRFNEVGYTNNNGYIGSVHDYFYDQSYGQFNLTFDIIGPITMPKGYGYYGQDIGGRGNDMHVPEMVGEALDMVDDEVDFSQYDWDGDGFVDQVFFIYAGCGQAQGGSSNTIWPHEWSLEDAEYYGYGPGIQEHDGVFINTYAVSCENQGGSGSYIDGIGTACHEFSHCLGFPDLYDTDYSGGVGMGKWDLLCSGSYNGPGGAGEVPAAFSSYERWMAGWLEPVELSNGCIIKDMEPITTSPECYVVYNEGNHNEFYMLENRQCEKWDAYTYGKGLLVIHIDYDYDVWVNNAVNDNPSHQRYTVIAADGSLGTSSREMLGDPFPGSTGKTALTDTSNPAATLYTVNTLTGTKRMGKPIENIADDNGLVSFYFMGGIPIAVPEAFEAKDVDYNTFTAQWSEVENATSYSVEIKEYNLQDNPEESLILNESFTRFEGTAKGGDHGNDISSELNEYMHQIGWTGKKIFSGPQRVRIGSSTVAGYLTTPSLGKPIMGSVTSRLRMASYSEKDTCSVVLSAIDVETGDVIAEKEIEVTPTLTYFNVVLDGIDSECKIKIASNKRAHLYYASFYDGSFSDIDFESNGGSSSDSDATVIEDITTNSYTFTNLTGEFYKYRVRAVCEEGATRWSNIIKVRIPQDPTSIQKTIIAPSAGMIYDLQGRRIEADKAKNGIYVIDGRKVIR